MTSQIDKETLHKVASCMVSMDLMRKIMPCYTGKFLLSLVEHQLMIKVYHSNHLLMIKVYHTKSSTKQVSFKKGINVLPQWTPDNVIPECMFMNFKL